MTLEERKKKMLEQVFQKSNIQQTAKDLNKAAQSVKPKTNTTTKTAAKSSGSAAKTNTVTQSASKPQSGLSSFQKLGNVAKTVQSVGESVLQSSNDMRNLQRNSILWHGTTDAATRQSLQQQNNAIRQRLGLSFDSSTGVTFDRKTGKNYSLPTQMLTSQSPGQKARMTSDYAQSREFMGKDAKDIVVQPTYEQILTYGADTARGVNAHQVMADLYTRAADTWSDADKSQKELAKTVLQNEMTRILGQFGLNYSESGLGASASWGMPNTVSDQTAVERLRQAGADDDLLAYIAENIELRDRTNRIKQGIESVGKQAVGAFPALVETSDQRRENLEQSRENPEYVKLEQEQQRLNAQLQEMQKKGQDVSSVVEYMKVYNELQEVIQQKDALAVKTPVDQSLWGQTMLREAAEAQANATAGLADVPRFLANTGISIAGNAPTMALSAIPGAGPVAGMALMGVNAAGQRAAELNAQGISPDEALGRGLTSGIIEGVTEKLPLDEMAKLLKGGGTSVVRNILRQMSIEAGEESASYLMNYAADWAANDPNAKISFEELAQSALGGMVSGGFFGAAGTLLGGARSTSIDTNPATHTPEQMTKINEYVNAVDEGLADFAERYIEDPNAKFGRYTISKVSPRQEQELKNLLGEDFSGYSNAINKGGINHIIKGHGQNGESDHSMGNVLDIARMGYVVENFDQVELLRNSDGSIVTSTEFRGKNNNPAPMVRFMKQINGSYYVVEAAAENKYKKLWVVSAYIGKNNSGTVTQVLDAANATPSSESSETPLASPVSAINNIAQEKAKSNAAQANTQALGRRLAELDAEKRQAETLLPGPIRDRAIQQAEEAMQRVQQEAAAQTTAPAAQTTAPPSRTEPSVQVPADAAFQYGLSPEAAMLEARERARNEAVQEAQDQQIVQDIERSEGAKRADNPYYGLTRQQLENELAFAKQRIERAQKDKNSKKEENLLNQYRQIEDAIADAKAVSFKRGDRVFALDRNNFGEIIKDRGDGYYDVYFVNAQTGENGIHILHGDLLQSIMPGEDVPRVTPQEAEERSGQVFDYSPEEFDRIIAENEVDQYADLPARDFSRFGNGKLRDGLGQDDQIRRDIEEMTNEADQQGQKQIIPESVALNINPVKMAYNKTLERVLDEAAGKSKTVRQFLQDAIEKPLAAAKSLYARSTKSQMDSYYKDMKETGIKLGSKESAAVMWYGEGKRMNEAGDYVDYTLADLKRDFPKKWKDIVKADSINRRMYDEYIQKIQQARREVYPYAEQRVELAISRKRAQAAAFSEQIKNLDAKIDAGYATPADVASRNQLMRELKAVEKDISQKIKDRDSGKAFANQRLFPRKDYYHHAMEMAEGFSALKNILETDMSIDPRLVGKSDNTKPNAKWSGILQKRKGVNALEDSIAAMLDYIPQAEYMINIDPQVARLRTVVRDLVDGTANADQTNANSLIEWLTDYTNDLAGKTNPFDRALQKVFSRKIFKAIEWINGRAKSNAILGNLNSAVAQVYNLPNGLAYVKDPRDISKGMTDFVAAKMKNGEARQTLAESGFMTERYLDSAKEQFDESLLHKPKQFAAWLLTAGDEQVSQMIWFSAYEQGKRKGVSDPIFYADDMTKRAVAGRGVGEVPLMQKAKLVKLIAPFQVEVSNAYYIMKEKVGAKDALGLTLLFLSTFLLNEVKEDLTGTRTGMDLIDAGSDAIKEVLDPEYEGGFLSKLATVGGRLGGEVLSNMPFGAQIASTLISDETQREKLFGESDPTRFGTGNIGIDAFINPVSQFLSGQEVNPWDTLTNIGLPWGGKQLSRGIDMAEDFGLLPVFRVSQDGVRFERQGTDAAYSEDGKQLKYAVDKDIGNILKGLAFGRYATDAGKAYIESGMKMLSEEKTEAFKKGVTEQGIDETTLYDAIVKMGQAESVKDAEGNTVTSAKEVARRLLFDRGDMTAEQKQWLDKQLLVDPDSDQEPADYSNYTNFVLSMYDSENRKEAAEEAVQHGLTVDQFVQWDDRLSEVAGMKDRFDKNQYTAAEARGIVLDEVMKDSALSDSEKQAIADYVLISSMDSDTQKELWETVAKGKVNATDFLRFKSDISAYEEGAKGTGTDNMANVATILRGYGGLTDEQRDILFQTYNETMSNNPFHVSTYEKAIADNSLYQSLTDEGKAALRALTNEYEQYINEGRALDEWRAKAYMAEKEAGIAPGTYALYRTVLKTVDAQNDNNNYMSQDEAETAINTIPGLTQYQKAYIWQSMNKQWKKNPFGSATVTEYQSGMETAINPVANGTQTSSFGPREQPTAGASTWHDGLDIGASEGEPIKAILSGKVIAKDYDYGGGYYVKIDHGNGRVSTYMHMKEGSTDNINVGDEVSQGQQIGAVGSTGKYSTGPHLDIRITQDGKYVDPLTVIPGYGIGPSGYVSGNTAAASTISSGVAAAQSSSKSSSSSTSSGFKDFDPFEAFEGLGF